jgi:hypothetical protein
MADLGLYRALAGGAGLAACIALLADQARAEAIAFGMACSESVAPDRSVSMAAGQSSKTLISLHSKVDFSPKDR